MSDEQQTYEPAVILREDPKPVVKRVAQYIVDRAQECERRDAERAEREKYGTRDELYVMLEKLPVVGQSDGPMYRGTVVSGLPVHERGWEGVSLSITDKTEALVLCEVRFQFAQALFAKRTCPTWDAAKLRAYHAEIRVADRRGF